MNELIRQSDALSEEETRLLFKWGEDIFGELPHQLTWRPKELHFVLFSDGKPLSHVGLLRHEVSVDGKPMKVAGLGGVVTVPEAQKQGIARRMMEHAMLFMKRAWEVEAGLLFCLPKMEAYYARLGWQTIDGPVLFDQPVGKVTSPLLVMVYPLREKAWPKGEVDLQGLPW
ncbi:MAG TPA: GNAT family N-acetyltransferase [Pyrinomonadaceae bacterium]|nr:GNAT family N-acetyltransferase [Pyrinomonadaceae bacterium]